MRIAMSDESGAVNRSAIVRTEKIIRHYIRRTPVIEIGGAEFGIETDKLCLKLELFSIRVPSRRAALSQIC